MEMRLPLADPEGMVAGVATPHSFKKNSGHPRGRCDFLLLHQTMCVCVR